MDPCINDILDYMHSRGYNCNRVLFPSIGDYCFILRPPGFPTQGVETGKQQFDYLMTELEKVEHILHHEYKVTILPEEDIVGFHYSIEIPGVNLKPETCRQQQKNAEKNAKDK